jgi:hypothetical protein
VTVERPGGYRMDVKVSWAALGLTPKPNSYIGFETEINDNDDGKARKAKVAWFGTEDNVWESPARMGTAKLAK